MDLITGGLGFIGNELARQLLARGREVVIMDNRRRVAPRISDLAGARVIEADLTDAAAARRAFAGLHPRNVFHLAAIHYIRKIVFTLRFLTHAEYSKAEWKNDL